METLRFIILGLACFRLALMVTKEDGPAWIFRRLRSLVKRKAPQETALKKGISCPWCVSMWMGVLLSLGEFFLHDSAVYVVIVVALALSGIAIIINQTFTKDK